MRRYSRHDVEPKPILTYRTPRRRPGSPNAWLQANSVAVLGAFQSLRPDERRLLAQWAKSAVTCGVDAVEDLLTRPWPCAVADAIIGIFRPGEDFAAWLVIGYGGAWIVASCADGTVTEQCASLSEALSQVYRSLQSA